MSSLSTHVLDAALGSPAAGIDVTLDGSLGGATDGSTDGGTVATTDADGRIRFDLELGEGTHSLVFATGAYFAAGGRATFYPEVTVTFAVDPEQSHYHVALLLSPFSYTTYRGS